jgi:hypothetical protein
MLARSLEIVPFLPPFFNDSPIVPWLSDTEGAGCVEYSSFNLISLSAGISTKYSSLSSLDLDLDLLAYARRIKSMNECTNYVDVCEFLNKQNNKGAETTMHIHGSDTHTYTVSTHELFIYIN